MKSKYKFAFRRQWDEIDFNQGQWPGKHPLCVCWLIVDNLQWRRKPSVGAIFRRYPFKKNKFVADYHDYCKRNGKFFHNTCDFVFAVASGVSEIEIAKVMEI